MNKKRLGRGLDALLAGNSGQKLEPTQEATTNSLNEAMELEISAIVASRYQPRQAFATEPLEELAASIKSQGLIQPILVRPKPQGGFELIAGERRWRAAKLAGLTKIPAVIRSVSDKTAAAMALIENIQREALGPLDEAQGLNRLQEEFGLTQQEVAEAVGKSRVAVTNLIRLLSLSPPVSELLKSGAIEMGHARALLSMGAVQQERMAQVVADKQLSVRETEALVRKAAEKNKNGSLGSNKQKKASDVDVLERELTDRLGAQVSITHNKKGKGKLEIKFSTLDELDGVLDRLRG